MKKLRILGSLLICAVLVLAVVFFLPAEAKAADSSALTFAIGDDGNYMVCDCDQNAYGKLVIPSTYNGKPVTEIGDEAFKFCDGLTSVVIPNSVTQIGEWAFYGCNGLASVEIPNSVRNIESLAFAGCENLTSVVLPNGITTISGQLFRYCESLTSVVIPNSVTFIDYYAFAGCTGLSEVVIPGSVTSIGHNAFAGCTGLSKLVIPGSVTSIGHNAFAGCTSLTSVILPKSVTWIADNAFYGCGSLSDVYYTGTEAQWGKIEVASGNGSLLYANITYNAKLAKITRQPANASATAGQVARTTLTATGDGLTYKWYYKDPGMSKYSLTTSFKTKNYSITMSEARDGRMVYCVVTDQYGTSVKSNAVKLSIAKIAITKQPTDFTTTSGRTATLTVAASGEGLTYQWYYKNAGASAFTKSSVKTASYSTKMDSTVNGRQLYCVVKDKFGNTVQSNTATLKMAAAVKITKQPASVSVLKGEMAAAKVTATGDGLTYKWYYKNKGASKFTYTDGFKGNTYSIEMTDARDGRQVYCVISDKYGNSVQTKTVTLSKTYTGPEITGQPKSVSAKIGEKVSATVTAEGKGLTYTWYYLNPGSTTLAKSSVTGRTYSFTLTAATAGRQVICIVIDQYGNAVSSNFAKFSKK